jgi:biopolymer transport protein ExbB
MDFIYSIVGFFVTGGPFMYPILLVFAVGTAIAVERTRVRGARFSPHS